MNRILFVDDEPKVLDGLRRMLYGFRNDWEMDFVSSSVDALRRLNEDHFDVVVTDIRMPGMNGIQLLDEVVKQHPEVIRIVLSGVADVEMALQSVSLSHQYLTKPCDARLLRGTVQRALGLRAILHNPNLRNLINRIQTLPSIPVVYRELVEALQSNNTSPTTVGAIVTRDMAMTAKMLQLVNSAYFGLSREISNPVDAVIYLGMDTVRSLVFTASAFSQFHLHKRSGFSIDELQLHSLAVGTLARSISRSMGLSRTEVEHTFAGGLLHDLGKLVLVSSYPDRYQDVIRGAARDHVPIYVREEEAFGTTHAEIGAYILWLWGLPEPVTEILALHHKLPHDLDSSRPAIAVHVADALVRNASNTELDLDALRAAGLYGDLAGWRSLYEETMGACDEAGTLRR